MNEAQSDSPYSTSFGRRNNLSITINLKRRRKQKRRISFLRKFRTLLSPNALVNKVPIRRAIYSPGDA
ncbi:MAG: hypothetical protein WDA42_09875 [Candidatus Bathyarchaeia archaeon]